MPKGTKRRRRTPRVLPHKCPECPRRFKTRLDMGRHLGGAHARTAPHTKIEHGTNSGYQKELRRGMVPCARCKKAHRELRTAYRKGKVVPIEEAAKMGKKVTARVKTNNRRRRRTA